MTKESGIAGSILGLSLLWGSNAVLAQDITIAEVPSNHRSLLVPSQEQLSTVVPTTSEPNPFRLSADSHWKESDAWQQPPTNETPVSAPPAKQPDDKDPKGLIQISPLKVPSISLKGIGTGSLPKDVVSGRLPPVQVLPIGFDRDIAMTSSMKQWIPSAICHKPLYFQDTMLERHGHERFPCVQSLASGVRFFGTLPILPYMMTLHPPAKDVSNLGYYRPGTAAPCLFERPPYDARALGVQTMVTTGAVLVIP